jgi:mobilome CxxCx(11)CxxC protein
MPIDPQKIGECTKAAINCFGTAAIFERRVNSLRSKTRFLTFLGIALPVTVGATAGAFTLDSKITGTVLIVSTIVSIPLAIFSVWSLVARWDDSLSYYLESKSDNELLAKQFRRLSSDPNIDQQSFQQQFSVLDAQNESRKKQDDKYPLTEKENRRGMRIALRNYSYPCAACQIIPISLVSTSCPVCGQF